MMKASKSSTRGNGVSGLISYAWST
jgi:hypothetical protein